MLSQVTGKMIGSQLDGPGAPKKRNKMSQVTEVRQAMMSQADPWVEKMLFKPDDCAEASESSMISIIKH